MGGKKFEKVSRIECSSDESNESQLVLDINVDLYSLEEGDKFKFALAETLALDSQLDDGVFDQSGEESLIDHYDYVMHGLIFKYKSGPRASSVDVFASFGGLLMKHKSGPRASSVDGLCLLWRPPHEAHLGPG